MFSISCDQKISGLNFRYTWLYLVVISCCPLQSNSSATWHCGSSNLATVPAPMEVTCFELSHVVYNFCLIIMVSPNLFPMNIHLKCRKQSHMCQIWGVWSVKDNNHTVSGQIFLHRQTWMSRSTAVLERQGMNLGAIHYMFMFCNKILCHDADEISTPLANSSTVRYLSSWTNSLMWITCNSICSWMDAINTECIQQKSFHFWTWMLEFCSLFPLQKV